MDKVISARLDESIVRQIGALATNLGTTKKAIIEGAIRLYAQSIEDDRRVDVLENTLGAWCRPESSAQTVADAREAFRRSMHRHQR